MGKKKNPGLDEKLRRIIEAIEALDKLKELAAKSPEPKPETETEIECATCTTLLEIVELPRTLRQHDEMHSAISAMETEIPNETLEKLATVMFDEMSNYASPVVLLRLAMRFGQFIERTRVENKTEHAALELFGDAVPDNIRELGKS